MDKWARMEKEIQAMHAKLLCHRYLSTSTFEDWFWDKQAQRMREILEMMELFEQEEREATSDPVRDVRD